MLTGSELELYRDHAQAAAACHLVLMRGSESCYVMFRQRWWRGLPFFAAILHVSNPELFRRATGQLARYLLVHHRACGDRGRAADHRPKATLFVPAAAAESSSRQAGPLAVTDVREEVLRHYPPQDVPEYQPRT